jgi:hypothetical protein
MKPPRRVFRIIAGEHDTKAALVLAREHGFDPDDKNSDDLLILRSIVVPEGQPAYSKAPRLTAW